MRSIVFRKMYMSILATMLVLITSVATTFAWVGMLSTSTFGGFEMNLKIEDYDSPYFLTISSFDATTRSAFGSSTAQMDIQKQILDNMEVDYSMIDSSNPIELNKYFNRAARLTPVTTDENLSSFYNMEYLNDKSTKLYKSNSYYKFDIYLSVDALEGIQATTEINANVFLGNIEKTLQGTFSTGALVNGNPFKKDSYIPSTSYDPLNILPNFSSTNLTIDSASAARVAFEIYEPIALSDTYSTTDTPTKRISYQGGTNLPSVSNNIYSFGGILPEEYNLAIQELNGIYNFKDDKRLTLTNAMIASDSSNFLGAYNRAQKSFDPSNKVELELKEENKSLWTKATTPDKDNVNYLGVHDGVQTKMKITVYFWFEGFDADCFQFIDYKNVDLSLTFATGKEN